MKCTEYFIAIRARTDRAEIRDEWIERAIQSPIRQSVEADGRIRLWTQVQEMEGRFLTIEHASIHAGAPEVLYEQLPA